MRLPAIGNLLTRCIPILLLLLFSDCTNLNDSFNNISSNNSSNVGLGSNQNVSVSKLSNITTAAGHNASGNCCDNNGIHIKNGSDSKSDPNQKRTTAHRIVVEFATNVVQNEYIVQFDGYYKRAAREKYIRTALNGSKVSNNYVFIFAKIAKVKKCIFHIRGVMGGKGQYT